jgi:hypothetical protein
MVTEALLPTPPAVKVNDAFATPGTCVANAIKSALVTARLLVPEADGMERFSESIDSAYVPLVNEVLLTIEMLLGVVPENDTTQLAGILPSYPADSTYDALTTEPAGGENPFKYVPNVI